MPDRLICEYIRYLFLIISSHLLGGVACLFANGLSVFTMRP